MASPLPPAKKVKRKHGEEHVFPGSPPLHGAPQQHPHGGPVHGYPSQPGMMPGFGPPPQGFMPMQNGMHGANGNGMAGSHPQGFPAQGQMGFGMPGPGAAPGSSHPPPPPQQQRPELSNPDGIDRNWSVPSLGELFQTSGMGMGIVGGTGGGMGGGFGGGMGGDPYGLYGGMSMPVPMPREDRMNGHPPHFDSQGLTQDATASAPSQGQLANSQATVASTAGTSLPSQSQSQPGTQSQSAKGGDGGKAPKPKRPRKKKETAPAGAAVTAASPAQEGGTPAATPAATPSEKPKKKAKSKASQAKAAEARATAGPEDAAGTEAAATPGPSQSRIAGAPENWAAQAEAGGSGGGGGGGGEGSASTGRAGAAASAAQAGNQRDGIDQLQDVMGASGVDLRAEEEAIQLASQSSQRAQEALARSTLESQCLQLYPLSHKVHAIATQRSLDVDADVLLYLSLATRFRLRNLLEVMIGASRHRSWSSHQKEPSLYGGNADKPMYHQEIVDDPRRALAALERAERGEEARMRRMRMERDRREAAIEAGEIVPGAAGMDVDGSGPGTPGGDDALKRLKKMNPAAAARNMSDEVRRRLANNTAARALGGASTPKWMTSGAAAAAAAASPLASKTKSSDFPSTPGGSLPKPRFAPQPGLSIAGGSTPGASSVSWAAAGGLAPSSFASGASAKASTTLGSKKVDPKGWGDLSARHSAREEEERRRARMVTLPDALHALEMERSGGAGRGSGERALYRARAKGLVGKPASAGGADSRTGTSGWS